jgi:hypothetical protein
MSNPSERARLFCRICEKEIKPNDKVSRTRLSLLDPIKYKPIIVSKNSSYPDLVHSSCFDKVFKKEWKHYSRDSSSDSKKRLEKFFKNKGNT